MDLVLPSLACLVLVVDQFEEVFTLTSDEHEREVFWSPFEWRRPIRRAGCG